MRLVVLFAAWISCSYALFCDSATGNARYKSTATEDPGACYFRIDRPATGTFTMAVRTKRNGKCVCLCVWVGGCARA